MDDKPAPLTPETAITQTKGGCHGESTETETFTQGPDACGSQGVLGSETRGRAQAETKTRPQNITETKGGYYGESTA